MISCAFQVRKITFSVIQKCLQGKNRSTRCYMDQIWVPCAGHFKNAYSASFTSNAYLYKCLCQMIIPNTYWAFTTCQVLCYACYTNYLVSFTLKSPRHFQTLIGSLEFCHYPFSWHQKQYIVKKLDFILCKYNTLRLYTIPKLFLSANLYNYSGIVLLDVIILKLPCA